MLRIVFGLLGVVLIAGTISASPVAGENFTAQPNNNNESSSTTYLEIPTYPEYVPPPPGTSPPPVDQDNDNKDNTSKQSIDTVTESNLQVQENWKTRIYTSLEPLKSYALSYVAHVIDTLVYITSTVVVGLISTSVFCSLTSLCNFELNGVSSTTEVYSRVKGLSRFLWLSEDDTNQLAGQVNQAIDKLNSGLARSKRSSEPTFEELTKTKSSPLDRLHEHFEQQTFPKKNQ